MGVDISAPMLEAARRLDRSGGRCTFLLSEHGDLRDIEDASVDLVYSERVLQHLPRPVLEACVGEFLRVLRPGAVAVLHCPSRPMWTLRGVLWRPAPFPVVAWLQRRLLGYPAPMRMTGVPEARMRGLVPAAGGELVAALVMDEPETHWRARRYVIRRDDR